MAQWQTCSNNLVWTLIRSQCWKVYTWLNSCSSHDEKSLSSEFFPIHFVQPSLTNQPMNTSVVLVPFSDLDSVWLSCCPCTTQIQVLDSLALLWELIRKEDLWTRATTPTVITPCRSYSAVFPCYPPSLNTSCRGCQGANRVSEHCQDHVGLFCFSDWLKKRKKHYHSFGIRRG